MKNDLISRQAAIEHLKKRLIETAINNIGVIARCDSIFEDTADNRIGPWLNELPSAQPEQRWIPCSERVPNKRGYYLTSTKDEAVYCDYWNEDNFDRTEMVIAWMPLPKPYKGGDHGRVNQQAGGD